MRLIKQSAGAMLAHPPAWSPDVRRSGDVKTISIPLTQGKYAVIDAADHELVSGFKWCVQQAPHTCYAVTAKRIPGTKKKVVTRLHRLILGAKPDEVVDHIDGDGLNNRRSNLRLCTPTENQRNTRKQKGTASQYKGVIWRRGKWRAQIQGCGHCRYLGQFVEERDAAIAYDRAALEMFGAFAKLNFPVPTEEVS